MRRVIPLMLLLAACGPMSPELAADLCEERARGATGPQGEVHLGLSSNGPVAGGEISISSDYLTGRDPQVIYEQCVYARTGQGPVRPLVLER
jgi:hypothetical protein